MAEFEVGKKYLCTCISPGCQRTYAAVGYNNHEMPLTVGIFEMLGSRGKLEHWPAYIAGSYICIDDMSLVERLFYEV